MSEEDDNNNDGPSGGGGGGGRGINELREADDGGWNPQSVIDSQHWRIKSSYSRL